MHSFGQKLRHERESRQTTIDEIARSTKIHRDYLEALERTEFAALPGVAFGKLYIRAYAEVLGIDPQPLIADYDREWFRQDPEQRLRVQQEQMRTRRTNPDRTTETASDDADQAPDEAELPAVGLERETPPTAAAAPPEHSEFDLARAGLIGATVGLVLVVIVVWVLFGQPDPVDASGLVPVETAAELPQIERSVAPAVDRAAEPAPERPETAPVPAVESGAADGRLRVSEFGVGREVVERRLVGEADRFEEGQVVWFSTRVLGGGRGETIRHVWSLEGRVVQTIELKLNGSHWRTHSNKTLWGAGSWTVEAQDAGGRVLARSRFDCVPATS